MVVHPSVVLLYNRYVVDEHSTREVRKWRVFEVVCQQSTLEYSVDAVREHLILQILAVSTEVSML